MSQKEEIEKSRDSGERTHEKVPEPRYEKRGATVSLESLVLPAKRRGRPRIMRTGSVGRPSKKYNTTRVTSGNDEDSNENSNGETENDDCSEQTESDT